MGSHQPWCHIHTRSIFELDLHFGAIYTPDKFHVCTSNSCNTIITRFCWLSITDKYTNTCQNTCKQLRGAPHYKTWLKNHLLIVDTHTHTDRRTNTLKTIPAFAITAGNNNSMNISVVVSWRHWFTPLVVTSYIDLIIHSAIIQHDVLALKLYISFYW